MKIDSLSTFFPAYNEEKNIALTVKKALEVLKSLPIKQYEVIIIDDGSKDKTPEISDELARTERFVRVIHKKNGGYGSALQAGFYDSKYDWIVCTDSDGQFDFADVEKLLEKTDQADLVIGYRVNRQDSFSRKLNGAAWTFLNNLLFGLKVRDVDCAFKLVKKEVIEKIPRLKSERGGMISPELLAKAKKAGFKITEVGVRHYPRLEGAQTGANFKVIIKSFVDLGKLWWQIK